MADGTVPIVIGKIPGYNHFINTKSSAIDYTQRLKNNLTTIKLRPTGYFIDFTKITDDLIASISLSDKAGNTELPSTNDLYKIGGTTKLGQQLKAIGVDTKVSSATALENWKRLVAGNIPAASANVNELQILATNDSTMTEVFGNSFELSAAERLSNSVGNFSLSQFAQNVKKATTVDSSLGLQMLEDTNSNSGLLSVITGKALGIQTALPKEWTKSDYTNSLQLMIKLVSPSGDEESIKEYILKPLKFLILAASPVTYNGITFGYPTLWEVEADGMMDIRLAGISAMTITRGGNETQFNRFNQPLNIDVRLTIEPLINGFATLANGATYNETNDDNYKNFLVTNPDMLDTSLKADDTQYTSIKL